MITRTKVKPFVGVPTEPGFYVARPKNSTSSNWEIVRTNVWAGHLVVWETGGEECGRPEDYEFRERLFLSDEGPPQR